MPLPSPKASTALLTRFESRRLNSTACTAAKCRKEEASRRNSISTRDCERNWRRFSLDDGSIKLERSYGVRLPRTRPRSRKPGPDVGPRDCWRYLRMRPTADRIRIRLSSGSWATFLETTSRAAKGERMSCATCVAIFAVASCSINFMELARISTTRLRRSNTSFACGRLPGSSAQPPSGRPCPRSAEMIQDA